jgi:hypothetical protein
MHQFTGSADWTPTGCASLHFTIEPEVIGLVSMTRDTRRFVLSVRVVTSRLEAIRRLVEIGLKAKGRV